MPGRWRRVIYLTRRGLGSVAALFVSCASASMQASLHDARESVQTLENSGAALNETCTELRKRLSDVNPSSAAVCAGVCGKCATDGLIFFAQMTQDRDEALRHLGSANAQIVEYKSRVDALDASLHEARHLLS